MIANNPFSFSSSSAADPLATPNPLLSAPALIPESFDWGRLFQTVEFEMDSQHLAAVLAELHDKSEPKQLPQVSPSAMAIEEVAEAISVATSTTTTTPIQLSAPAIATAPPLIIVPKATAEAVSVDLVSYGQGGISNHDMMSDATWSLLSDPYIKAAFDLLG